MTPLRLVADDLTGALDSAAPFTGQLGAVPVWLGTVPAAAQGSFALDLNCRDGSDAEAVRRVRTNAHHLAGAAVAFKKIDSLLRGHWAAELATIVELGMFDRIVLAPAFPAQARVTRDGRQYVRDHEGRWIAAPVDPAHELAQRGIRVASGKVDAAERLGPASILLCDAETDQDLATLIGVIREEPGRTLWCGSAGLAQALAQIPPQAIELPQGTHLGLIGSDHAVTRSQLAMLEGAHPDCLIRLGTDAGKNAADIGNALARYRGCMAVPALVASLSPAEAERQISSRLAALLPRLPQPGALTVVGGETFTALCRHLRCTVLAVEGEWRPGVPASRMVDGAWAGTRCFSKSGAFGGSDLLLDLLGLAVGTQKSAVASREAD